MQKRAILRWLVALALIALTYLGLKLFAGSYEPNADPEARYQIQAVRLEPDRSFHWLEIHIKKSGNLDHDLTKPVRLITQKTIAHEPADTKFAGAPEQGFTDIWFKFWLNDDDLKLPIALNINGGTLNVKSNTGSPPKKNQVYKTANWNSSWLGF